jgi:hypothetical protein
LKFWSLQVLKFWSFEFEVLKFWSIVPQLVSAVGVLTYCCKGCEHLLRDIPWSSGSLGRILGAPRNIAQQVLTAFATISKNPYGRY